MLDETKKHIQQIHKIITMLNEQNVACKEDYFWDNHPDLVNKYPFLISYMCNNTDLSMLNIMLDKVKDIENGVTTHENASVQIGKLLANKYLNSKIK